MSKPVESDQFHYVALGDSLANGVGAKGQGYPQQLQALLQQRRPTRLHLFATNGQTSTRLLRQQGSFSEALKTADLVTINIGGNDLRLTWRFYGHNLTPKSLQKKRLRVALTTLANNWNELARLVLQHTSPQCQVVFINLYNPFQQKYPNSRSFVTEANRTLETICANHGYTAIDARGLLNAASKKETEGRDTLLAADRLHLSQQGHTLIAQSIYGTVYPTTIWGKMRKLLWRSRG